MKEKQVPMMKSNAAVAELNKVAGFDPVKLLNSALSKKQPDEAEAARLNLRFKKLWFRLAYPQGRIRLSALRLTDQLAIIEAKIFFHKDDPEPMANFVAERRAQDTPLYIQAAQYEAQDNVLTDAGFGIQLCDVCQTTGEEAYIPRGPAPVGTEETPPAQATEEPAPGVTADTPVTPPAPVADIPPKVQDTGAGEKPSDDAPGETGAVVETVETGGQQPPARETGGYSPSMTVDEITARMTVEEALAIIADVGMCRGQTLAQIADRRPASLRWYMVGCKEASNVLKAGAQLVLESLSMPKSA